MPRISAATVAEHRAAQHAALLEAAGRLVRAGGGEPLTLARVAREAGMSRTSVYDYVPSVDELVAELALVELPAWTARLGRAVARARTPRTRLAAYVRETVALMRSGDHRVAAALEGLDVGEATRLRLAELHADLLAPLRRAVGDRPGEDAAVVAALVYGALGGAMALVDRGGDEREVSRTTTVFLTRALEL